jgi:eukaryotic-like serine/threonine-protein kinase
MSMLRLDDRLAGRFRIDARIAEGGMGVVYRGFDLEIDQAIAVKVLRPGAIDNVARFEREATLLATLHHPGVIRYVTHGVAYEGSPFLVTEWIEGTTLTEHHAHVGLTPAETLAISCHVAEALGAAHARGLVHRDIKPDNILLAGGDLKRPMVIDFGLVRSTSGDHRLTETGVVVGTPGYMAPEQARGEREIDARSDVFALGCVLYECITGMPAFAGRNVAAVMARIVLCDPPPLRELWPAVPPALERLVARMLAKRREDRPRDAAAVAAELRAITAPAGPARRRATSDGETTAVSRSSETTATHVIFLQATPPAAEVDAIDAINAIVAPFEGLAHALIDGTIIVVLERDAAAAADCALALARSFAQAPIVLVGASDAGAPDAIGATSTSRSTDPTTTTAAPLAVLLDAGAGELEIADFERIFASGASGASSPPLPGTIRVDPATAARLARQFDVREDRGALYLIGRTP